MKSINLGIALAPKSFQNINSELFTSSPHSEFIMGVAYIMTPAVNHLDSIEAMHVGIE